MMLWKKIRFSLFPSYPAARTKDERNRLISATVTTEAAVTTLGSLVLGDGDDGDGDGVEAEVLEQVLGLVVDLNLARGVVAGVKSRDLRNVLILALTLLLLKLEGDTTDGTTLDTLHQVGGVSGNLVAEALGGDDGNLIADTLVGLKVKGQARVVSLNDDLGGLLDGLGTDATHCDGLWW